MRLHRLGLEAVNSHDIGQLATSLEDSVIDLAQLPMGFMLRVLSDVPLQHLLDSFEHFTQEQF